MEHKKFISKLEKVSSQYNTEEALTPIIYQLVDSSSVSIMVIQNARGTIDKNPFYGISSNPDIAILDDDFKNDGNLEEMLGKMYGCVEIKKIDYKLIDDIDDVLSRIKLDENKNEKNKDIMSGLDIDIDDAGQLLGEVLWYRKVIYTNGIKWLFIECSMDNTSDEEYIETIASFAKKESEQFRKEKNWFGRLANEEWVKDITIEQTVFMDKTNIRYISSEDYKILKEKLTAIEWF